MAEEGTGLEFSPMPVQGLSGHVHRGSSRGEGHAAHFLADLRSSSSLHGLGRGVLSHPAPHSVSPTWSDETVLI